MSRPRTGSLVRTPSSQGVSYGIRWMQNGRRAYHHLGGNWEGWDDDRAESERAFIMAKVKRGEYEAPRPQPVEAAPGVAPSFQVTASNWLHRFKLGANDPDGRSKTSVDLTWRLTVAIEHFGDVPIDQLEFRHASDMVAAIQADRLAIARAAERGEPLKQDYVDVRTGRTHQRVRRGLSNSSIRKILDVCERVLADARRRREYTGELPELKAAVGKLEKPRRSYLEVEQLVACVRAAHDLEDQHRGMTWEKVAQIRASSKPNVQLARDFRVSDTLIRKIKRRELWNDEATGRRRNDVPRSAILLTLALAGPRVSELCALDARQVETTAGRVRVDGTKTDAAARVVPLVPRLLEALIEHRVDLALDSGPAFPTRDGGRMSTDGVRDRLATIQDRANVILEAAGRRPIAHLTPHTLRRTFASILAVCNVPPRRAMYLLGHADAKFTMSVYQQVLDVPEQAVGDLETLLGCTLEEARAMYSGREVLPVNCQLGAGAGARAQIGSMWEA